MTGHLLRLTAGASRAAGDFMRGLSLPVNISAAFRLVSLNDLDGHTIAGKRARRLADALGGRFGGSLTLVQRRAVERAAVLSAFADHAERAASIQPADVARLHLAAARAIQRTLPEDKGPRPASGKAAHASNGREAPNVVSGLLGPSAAPSAASEGSAP